MFLSEDFNALIEVTKAILFNRSQIYPAIKNRKQIENKLKIEMRRPEKTGDFYDVSVVFIGPWRRRLFLPRILWQTFNSYEDDVVTMAAICKSESVEFVTIFSYELVPKPSISYVCPEIVPADEEQSWNLDLKNKSVPCSGEPSVAMTEVLFKFHCSEGLDVKLAKNYQEFLTKTCFMFYDLTFNFAFGEQTFVREGNLTIPLPWSTSRRLKKFFKFTLGEAESVGSTWVSQEEDNKDVQPFDFTVVNYGIAGDGNCLPVWVLGPSGVPMPGFSKTFFLQMVCQAAELPLDLMDEQYTPPANLPPPDFCLQLPPQHSLAKRDNFLVIVLMLPIKHRKFTKHSGMIKYSDTMAARNWDPLVEVLTEVLQNPVTSPEEVTKSIDGKDKMEEMLLEYLEEQQKKPVRLNYRLILRVPKSAKEIMKQNREQFLEDRAARRKARAEDPNNDDSDTDDGATMALAYRQYYAAHGPWPSRRKANRRNKRQRLCGSESKSDEDRNWGSKNEENISQGPESEESKQGPETEDHQMSESEEASKQESENEENISQGPESEESKQGPENEDHQMSESEEASKQESENEENSNLGPESEESKQGPENEDHQMSESEEDSKQVSENEENISQGPESEESKQGPENGDHQMSESEEASKQESENEENSNQGPESEDNNQMSEIEDSDQRPEKKTFEI